MLHEAKALSPFADEAHARNRLTLPVLCSAVLIAQVDSSIVNLAARPIGAHFRRRRGGAAMGHRQLQSGLRRDAAD
ncbi:MAG TPA: hypothetical protein VFE63_15155 [Roseiarcus sp.]|jgi:hypothetical protein|nr:hypothetical protein [Roseiarcus sp.]